MNPAKEQICREVDGSAQDLFAVSDFLLNHPEIAFQEHEASLFLSRFLSERGFEVRRGLGGLETAFLGVPSGQPSTRPTVALLAEYDALPKIGHGCGHNMIAAVTMGAALALNKCLGGVAGTIAVVGTPAEEGGGGKVFLAEAGVFREMDVAMMCHPGQINIPGKDMLGRIKFKLEFFGRTAHASGSPDQGINALDALVLAYNGMNALRQHLRGDGRIHGIITHGGDAPNVIPDYAAGLFYVRAGTRAYRDEIFERVRNCATGAAMALGARCNIEIFQPVLDPIKRNLPLEEALGANMGALGIPTQEDDGSRGSSDIGNLSHYLPAIHPLVAIVDSGIPGHSTAFAEATTTPRGREALLTGAKLLGMTAYDFLTSEPLRQQVAETFAKER